MLRNFTCWSDLSAVPYSTASPAAPQQLPLPLLVCESLRPAPLRNVPPAGQEPGRHVLHELRNREDMLSFYFAD